MKSISKNLQKIWLCVVGIICIGISIRCFTYETSRHVQLNDYGEYSWDENAYEGIQHATAITAGNVSELKEFEKFGFGSVFLVTGLILLGGQLPKDQTKAEEIVENPFDDNAELV